MSRVINCITYGYKRDPDNWKAYPTNQCQCEAVMLTDQQPEDEPKYILIMAYRKLTDGQITIPLSIRLKESMKHQLQVVCGKREGAETSEEVAEREWAEETD